MRKIIKRQAIFIARYAIVALLLLSCPFLNGCDFFSWQRYYNKEYRFSILLPRSWGKVKKFKDAVVMVIAPAQGPADRFQENINVVVKDMPTYMSLEVFFESNKEEIMMAMPGVYNVSEGGIFSGLTPGRWLAFNSKVQGGVLRILSAVWIKEKRVYVVTCMSLLEEFPKYESTFQKVLRSLRF